MKKIIVISSILALLFVGFLFAQNTTARPSIVFDETIYDFGQLSRKQKKATHVFHFKNTGTADLIIKDVTTSCGCTVPQWTQTPIAPGQQGEITVTYNTSTRGEFIKRITVKNNSDLKKALLTIKGQVIDD